MTKTMQQRKSGTTCTRCGEPRWPFKQWTEPYTCQRCLTALAGGNAIDPLPSEAQRASRVANLGRSFGQLPGVGAVQRAGGERWSHPTCRKPPCPLCHTVRPMPDPRFVTLIAMLIEDACRESPATTSHWRKPC